MRLTITFQVLAKNKWIKNVTCKTLFINSIQKDPLKNVKYYKIRLVEPKITIISEKPNHALLWGSVGKSRQEST